MTVTVAPAPVAVEGTREIAPIAVDSIRAPNVACDAVERESCLPNAYELPELPGRQPRLFTARGQFRIGGKFIEWPSATRSAVSKLPF